MGGRTSSPLHRQTVEQCNVNFHMSLTHLYFNRSYVYDRENGPKRRQEEHAQFIQTYNLCVKEANRR